MTFVKLWHFSTDVNAHILVVNKEIAALSPKNRIVFIRIRPDATRNFVQKIKYLSFLCKIQMLIQFNTIITL